MSGDFPAQRCFIPLYLSQVLTPNKPILFLTPSQHLLLREPKLTQGVLLPVLCRIEALINLESERLVASQADIPVACLTVAMETSTGKGEKEGEEDSV